jgi:REP element-mobilizing transposase RayT
MPPACPGELHARRYTPMPPACPGEPHAGRYTPRLQPQSDAPGLRGGASRSSLQCSSQRFLRKGKQRVFIQAYQLDELKFAWCYRVYYRWRTHRASPRPALARLDQATLDALLQPYGIHVLEVAAGQTDVKLLASLLPADEQRLSAQHAVTILRLHLVLSTWRRKGVFGRTEGEAIATRWRQMQDELAIALEKVSFVPDYVHLAVRFHPSVSPAIMVVALMNAAQEQMRSDFPDVVIRAGVERLSQPSAYLGAFGELESAKIAAYVRRWEP